MILIEELEKGSQNIDFWKCHKLKCAYLKDPKFS